MTAKISLDYELIQSYSLTIEVRDGGPDGGLVCFEMNGHHSA